MKKIDFGAVVTGILSFSVTFFLLKYVGEIFFVGGFCVAALLWRMAYPPRLVTEGAMRCFLALCGASIVAALLIGLLQEGLWYDSFRKPILAFVFGLTLTTMYKD